MSIKQAVWASRGHLTGKEEDIRRIIQKDKEAREDRQAKYIAAKIKSREDYRHKKQSFILLSWLGIFRDGA